MRVLFYGGCHGATFHQIFNRFATVANFVSHPILNYVLIDNGTPFPVDDLVNSYDALVLNPILNHKEYDTNPLVELCHKKGIKVVSYPWLQWNGYFPRIGRGVFGFEYPDIVRVARETPDLESLRKWTETACLTESEIQSGFDTTTGHLIRYEEEGECTIRISEMVLRDYKSVRLFNSPDHPSNVTLKFVAKAIAGQLGIQLDSSIDGYMEEFQGAEMTPILPQVRDVLGLKFSGNDYRLEGKWGQKSFSLAEWLSLYRSAIPGRVVLWSVYNGDIELEGGRILSVPERSPLIAEPGHDETEQVFAFVDGPLNIKAQIGAERRFRLLSPYWHRVRV